jgi:hypothetical protein
VNDPSRRGDNRRGPPFLRLPWWFWFAYVAVRYWLVTVPVAVLLAIAGRYGDWPIQARWVVFGAVAILALPFAATAVVLVVRNRQEAACWRSLDRDQTVFSLYLPAGSRIRFAEKTRSRLISIDLPHATDILGIRVVGTLTWHDKWGHFTKVWSGILAEDQCLDGLPCRAGPIGFDKDYTVFDTNGVVQRFMLAAAHELLGLKLPRGTMVKRGDDHRPWNLLLPADAGVEIPALATTAPPGVTLSVATDGTLQQIGSGHGQTIVVSGVPLNSKNFHVRGGQVISELAAPFLVAGERQPAGAAVLIDLGTACVQLAGR